MNCMRLHVITSMMNDAGCILNSFYFVIDRNLVYSRQDLTSSSLHISLLKHLDLTNYKCIYSESRTEEIDMLPALLGALIYTVLVAFC